MKCQGFDVIKSKSIQCQNEAIGKFKIENKKGFDWGMAHYCNDCKESDIKKGFILKIIKENK